MQECWLHIGLMYYKLIRPTFLSMGEDPSRDDGNSLGLNIARSPRFFQELGYWPSGWQQAM